LEISLQICLTRRVSIHFLSEVRNQFAQYHAVRGQSLFGLHLFRTLRQKLHYGFNKDFSRIQLFTKSGDKNSLAVTEGETKGWEWRNLSAVDAYLKRL
jgi:hypothetical protein